MSDCLFCGIAEKKIKADIVHESAEVVAFKDIHPQAPVHYLFIPKRHISGVQEAIRENPSVVEALYRAADETIKGSELEKKGYRLLINCKSDGGQTVNHLHLHLLGGRPMKWPPG